MTSLTHGIRSLSVVNKWGHRSGLAVSPLMTESQIEAQIQVYFPQTERVDLERYDGSKTSYRVTVENAEARNPNHRVVTLSESNA